MIQSSSLVLKTSDISTTKNAESASSECGSWSNYKQVTRFNVDLRTCIGPEIYDRHDRFVLRLNSVSWTAADAGLANSDDHCVIQMSGLNFVNSTYSIKQKTNTAVYDLCVVNMIPTENKTLYFTQNVSMAQFTKSGDFVTIEFDLMRTLDGLPASWGGVDSWPHFVYMFDIYPL